jgi:Beta-propeller repeat
MYDDVTDIAVDKNGSAYPIGRTNSTDFPNRPGGVQCAPSSTFWAFLIKLDPSGSSLDAQ